MGHQPAQKPTHDDDEFHPWVKYHRRGIFGEPEVLARPVERDTCYKVTLLDGTPFAKLDHENFWDKYRTELDSRVIAAMQPVVEAVLHKVRQCYHFKDGECYVAAILKADDEACPSGVGRVLCTAAQKYLTAQNAQVQGEEK